MGEHEVVAEVDGIPAPGDEVIDDALVAEAPWQ